MNSQSLPMQKILNSEELVKLLIQQLLSLLEPKMITQD